MDKEKQILEALHMQPLSEEEKASRHILGRLYGPIATCEESTRNGRKYNRELWEKALSDEVFKEKVANKSLFLELGHPADREETDMEKVCACIPCVPTIVDGDLYAYVDILDTRNGKTLKLLCDYGFVPGISSRGSGDIMANDEVDPETFFLETWDIVQLPAVKKARLKMCESLDGDAAKLRKALTESYNAASDEEKKDMAEALSNLDISLDLDDNDDGIEYEDPNETAAEDDMLVEENTEEELPEDEEETKEEKSEESKEEPEEKEAEDDEDDSKDDTKTVGDFIKDLKEFDKDLPFVINPVAIDDKEYTVEIADMKDDKDGLKLDLTCVPVEGAEEDINDEQSDADKAADEDKADEPAEEPEVEAQDEPDEAADDGADEVIENLKEMVRQKDSLESELKNLKAEKTVSDAEVKGLKEELEKYKTGFARTSEIAAKSSKFEKEVHSLNEQLALKEKELSDLRTKAVNNSTSLTESVNAHDAKVKSLTEKLDAMQKDLTASETKLNEQRTQYRGKLNEAVTVAKAYKSKYEAVMTKYIETRASMLGVKPSAITGMLNENYSIEDIDKACDEMLESSMRFNNLPCDINGNSRIAIRESRTATSSQKKPVNPDNGYEIDPFLYELAGIKK